MNIKIFEWLKFAQQILKQSFTHAQANSHSVMFAFIRHRQQAQSTCLLPLYIDHIPTSIWYLRSAFCDECNVFINPHSFLRSNFWKIFTKLTILHMETVTHRETEESDSSITKYCVSLESEISSNLHSTYQTDGVLKQIFAVGGLIFSAKTVHIYPQKICIQ